VKVVPLAQQCDAACTERLGGRPDSLRAFLSGGVWQLESSRKSNIKIEFT
jgi:hypothetical protein